MWFIRISIDLRQLELIVSTITAMKKMHRRYQSNDFEGRKHSNCGTVRIKPR